MKKSNDELNLVHTNGWKTCTVCGKKVAAILVIQINLFEKYREIRTCFACLNKISVETD